jgi:ABC-2 type transport system permease protein
MEAAMGNKKNKYLLFSVASWEFRRWFKVKDYVISLIITLAAAFILYGGKELLNKLDKDKIEIVVLNSDKAPITLPTESKLKLINKPIEEKEEYEKKLAAKEIEGILVINSIDGAVLHVNKEPHWINEIIEALNLVRQNVKLKESGIAPRILDNIFKPFDIKIQYTLSASKPTGTGEKIAAGILIGLMIVGIFITLSYQFVSVTGEKQLRITEVIVSAITPQTWIDGKILGISMLSILSLIFYGLSSLLFVAVANLFGSGWKIPLVISNPFILLMLILYALLGFLLWNIFFIAIAATINDPNTSARSSLMFLPLIPAGAAFFVLGNPDSTSMLILSLFPFTAPSVLVARMVLSPVPAWQILLSLLLILTTIYYIRRLAGKIFEVSILMYGKEPSWKEIAKWAGRKK